jgi:hypothetical protein
VGGVGGLLKTVERSLMTFPDAHILLYLMIYIIKVYKFIQRVPQEIQKLFAARVSKLALKCWKNIYHAL